MIIVELGVAGPRCPTAPTAPYLLASLSTAAAPAYPRWRHPHSTEPAEPRSAMEYTKFGNTGLEVSRICLGMMSYGDPGWRNWVLPEDEAGARSGRAPGDAPRSSDRPKTSGGPRGPGHPRTESEAPGDRRGPRASGVDLETPALSSRRTVTTTRRLVAPSTRDVTRSREMATVVRERVSGDRTTARRGRDRRTFRSPGRGG